jgi:hypothetical protein
MNKDSYIDPLMSELEKRARLNQAIYRLLDTHLKNQDASPSPMAPRINNLWAYELEPEEDEVLIGVRPTTEYGVPLYDYIKFGLFRAKALDENPEADMLPVLDIYVAENGTVRDGPPQRGFGVPDELNQHTDQDVILHTFVELNSDELTGLLNDFSKLFSI